jgi:hypothetical protein
VGRKGHGKSRGLFFFIEKIFRKWDVGVWTGSSWLRVGAGEGQL